MHARVCMCVCVSTHKDTFRGLMASERSMLHDGVRNLISFTKQTFQLCRAFQHFPLILLISSAHHLHKQTVALSCRKISNPSLSLSKGNIFQLSGQDGLLALSLFKCQMSASTPRQFVPFHRSMSWWRAGGKL